MDYLHFLKQNARWLLAAMLITFSSGYGQTFFISVFAGEIRQELGLSHGAWGGIYTLGTTLSAIVMVWAGTLTDRFRARTLAPAMLFVLAISCLAMAAVPSSGLLVVVIFWLRFTGQGMLGHVGMVATARWFSAARGRALSIAALGFSLANAILPLLFVALLVNYSWRTLWVVAAGMAILGVPVLLSLLQHERTPQTIAASGGTLGMDGRNWNRADLLKHPLFWLMVPALLGPSAWGTALFFQQVHLVEVKGWSHLEFVALFPIYTVATVAMTIVSGAFVDRYGANRVMPFLLVPYTLGFLVLSFASTLWGAALSLILIGLSTGMNSTVNSAFWAEHFGTKHLGSIKSLAAAVMVFGSAIGPGITGLFIDFGIDFPTQMIWISVYFVLSTILAAVGCQQVRPSLAASS